MNRRLTHALVVASLLTAAGCANGTPDKKAEEAKPAVDAVAIVNGEPITRDVWNLWLKAKTQGTKEEDLTPEQKNEELDGLVEMYLAASEAKKEGLDQGENGARLLLMQKSTLADLAGRKFLEGKDPTPEEMKAEYDKQVAAMPKTEYRARHILVESEAKARELIAALDSGADFSKLAKENSIDPSGKNGGDLDWFAPSHMVEPFAKAVEQLQKGSYTKEPVKTQFGWHVIRLDDTRPLPPPSYENVEQQLGQMVRQSKFKDYLDGLLKTAKVERKL